MYDNNRWQDYADIFEFIDDIFKDFKGKTLWSLIVSACICCRISPSDFHEYRIKTWMTSINVVLFPSALCRYSLPIVVLSYPAQCREENMVQSP